MGLFGNRKEFKANAAQFTKIAETEAKAAREAARKVAAYKKSLKSGKSGDPAADRYLIRQHDASRRIHQANARDFKRSADAERKRWF
jgi:hypothetical protein